jgi:hypothetical protein
MDSYNFYAVNVSPKLILNDDALSESVQTLTWTLKLNKLKLSHDNNGNCNQNKNL